MKSDQNLEKTHKALIQKFYQSFSNGDAMEMVACYHDDIVFEDPAFGTLKGEKVKNMWRMLLERSKGEIKVEYGNIEVEGEYGAATWIAYYNYGRRKLKVVNHVQASFQFKDDKIIQHTDHFDLWKWTQQALGPAGYLLGWSSFMKNKIQKSTNKMLDDYMSKH